MKIMLDAGHYGYYNRSPVVPSYYESLRMWTLCEMLAEELEKFGITVGKTRSDASRDLSVTKRGKLSKGYDIFISLHSNACSSESVDRVEVYAPLDKRNNSHTLALALSNAVAKLMGVAKAGVKTRRSSDGKSEYYGVMRGSASVGCPMYFIIEHSFHTNKKSALWLLNDTNLRALARSEAEAVADFFGIKRPRTKGDVNNDGNIDAVDATLAKRAVLGTVVLDGDAKESADMNDDGVVDSIDYALIKRKVMNS